MRRSRSRTETSNSPQFYLCIHFDPSMLHILAAAAAETKITFINEEC